MQIFFRFLAPEYLIKNKFNKNSGNCVALLSRSFFQHKARHWLQLGEVNLYKQQRTSVGVDRGNNHTPNLKLVFFRG